MMCEEDPVDEEDCDACLKAVETLCFKHLPELLDVSSTPFSSSVVLVVLPV